MTKTDAAKETLLHINPDVNIESYTYSITSLDNWAHFLDRITKGGINNDRPVDLVLGCVDNFEARIAINQVTSSLPLFPPLLPLLPSLSPSHFYYFFNHNFPLLFLLFYL